MFTAILFVGMFLQMLRLETLSFGNGNCRSEFRTDYPLSDTTCLLYEWNSDCSADRMRLHHKRLHWRQWILLLEILLLAVVPFIQSDLIANSLISMSCAIQVQSFRKIHGHPFASTMCIGNMRNMMDNLAMFIHTKDQMYLKYSAGYLRIIFYFILGCLLGGLLMIKMGIYTIMISVLLLFAAFIMMFYHSESEELKELENEYSNFTKHFNEQ